MKRKTKLAIINRNFWPENQIIGEALLQYGELATQYGTVVIITQTNTNLVTCMREGQRGDGLIVHACKAYTTSSSHLLSRIIEAIFFTLWVFIALLRNRPENIYISTNPPVIVPFIVAIYCRLSGAKYLYHLQDIHPEITNLVAPLNKILFRILQTIDNYTLRHAKILITLSEEMRSYLIKRSGTKVPVKLLDNPGIPVSIQSPRTDDVIFCGNIGRVNRIPLLCKAIERYVDNGGSMGFTFAGGGIHASLIRALSNNYEQVKYVGEISASNAAVLVARHRWALLPIDDEITRYAFPSKSSGYVLSSTPILAICGRETSVGQWIEKFDIGIVCEPIPEILVKCFFKLENWQHKFQFSNKLSANLQLETFAKQLITFTFAEDL